MTGSKLPATLHLCFVAGGPTIFDVAADIYTGVDVATKVAKGFIDLLVAVAALTSLGARRVAVVA